jgi:hypothetical protein
MTLTSTPRSAEHLGQALLASQVRVARSSSRGRPAPTLFHGIHGIIWNHLEFH